MQGDILLSNETSKLIYYRLRNSTADQILAVGVLLFKWKMIFNKLLFFKVDLF